MRGVVDVADDLFRDDGNTADIGADGLGYFPSDFGYVGRHAADDLAFEVREDFGVAGFPPLFGCGDLRAVFGDEQFGEIGKRVRFGGIVIGGVGGIGAAARTRAQLRDAELRKHVGVILRSGPGAGIGGGRGRRLGGCETHGSSEREQEEGDTARAGERETHEVKRVRGDVRMAERMRDAGNLRRL